MIVLDANILIRAVLGRRVRQLVETYAPEAYASLHLTFVLKMPRGTCQPLLTKHGKPCSMFQLRSNTCGTSLNPFKVTFTAPSNTKLVNVCAHATRTIGPYWPPRSGWLARSGARMQTSSEQVLRSGLQLGLRSSSKWVPKPAARPRVKSHDPARLDCLKLAIRMARVPKVMSDLTAIRRGDD